MDNVEVGKIRPGPLNEVSWIESPHDHLAPGVELEKNKALWTNLAQIRMHPSKTNPTKLVASFAGFAPVSSPAISVAVVIDTPTVGPSKYGAAVSAPVFATVAQQVLEHSRPVRAGSPCGRAQILLAQGGRPAPVRY